MNFNEMKLLPMIFVLFSILVVLIVLFEKRYFKFVNLYWFYKRSLLSYASSIFFLVGMAGLLTSLLDLRGQEEIIKMPVPSSRTIILLDTSASMLAEDVRPSRLKKSLLIAKHFARKAAGQQISVIAFSEVHKKIIPFTTDLDLIDSRLDSLGDLKNHYGSSALSLALQESVQYFKDVNTSGAANILVLTDGEETTKTIKVNIPSYIKVAFIGVGTDKGGTIPLESKQGIRMGFKTHRGQKVITKLNESFFKDLVSDIKQAKYWKANSYSLPTEDIVRFFNDDKLDQNQKGQRERDITIKPVLMHYLVLPSLALLMISYILKFFKTFRLSILIFFLFIPFSKADNLEVENKNERQLSAKTQEMMRELEQGELHHNQKIKLADNLYREGLKKDGLSLFEESLSSGIEQSVPYEAYLNYGSALLESGKEKEGLRLLHDLLSELKKEEDPRFFSLIQKMESNISAYFQMKKNQQDKKSNHNQKKDKKDQQNQQDKQNNQENQENQSQQDQQNQQNNQENDNNKNQQQDPQTKNDHQKSKDQENPKDTKSVSEDKKSQDQQKESEDQEDQNSKKEESDQSKRENTQQTQPQKGLSAKLKQLLSDDRKLQMKVIESETRDLNKKHDNDSKGW